MLQQGLSYAEQRARFRWNVPERYNIAADVCDRHADGSGRLALIYELPDGGVRTYSFDELQRLSCQLANAFEGLGVRPGDRVAILLGQRPETALAHLACYRIGAIALPLFTLFGPDALQYRLSDSGAKLVVTDGADLHKLDLIRGALPELKRIVVTEPQEDAADGEFWSTLALGRDSFDSVDSGPDDPAMVLYTSGTTGPPKGALHGHRVLLGHCPSIEFNHEFFPRPGDLFWTPADWAWAGGLLDCLLPSWRYGVPVLAHRAAKFDPEYAYRLMARHKVRNVFLPPTALKMMRQVARPEPVSLRTLGSGGESLGAEMIDWGRERFGLTINEFWGQTEANLLAGNCAACLEVRPGSLGVAAPGHEVAVVDPEGNPLPDGEKGILAARRPDPVFLLEYWRNPEATAAKYAGDWLLTGDVGVRDADGYFWFEGRDDDIISSGAYRIGPSEIEDCLIKHPAVALAAVIGAPDPVRGQVVKAFVQPAGGRNGSPELAAEIQQFVRTRLAAHQYPRLVEFVDSLPMTATGKIRRKDLRDKEYARSVDR